MQDPALEPAFDSDIGVLEDAVTAPARNPYMGLHPFREVDRDLFHGRGSLIEQVVETLAGGTRVATVIGPSGSGKSSVIHAWVIPALRDGTERGRMTIATMQHIAFLANGFSQEVWEPFARWVADNYPDDAAVMYTNSNQTLQRISEESNRLWEQRTREYVSSGGT